MRYDRIARFEEQIQRLIEGGFARLFAGRLHPREVAIRLARAMEDHARPLDSGTLLAPDVYLVRLNPEDAAAILEGNPAIVVELAADLLALARAGGLTLAHEPDVRIETDEGILPHTVDVEAHHSSPRTETTQALVRPGLPLLSTTRAAALIMGDRHIPLVEAVTNLGRHRSNHLIIDDPRVSRHHAQIRLRGGEYVLFDLGSRGGTTVNGQRVREAVLRSGDVIALSGCQIIYVEESVDDVSPDDHESTRPYLPDTDIDAG